ncbi:hypothetical protein NUW58_g7475 [Xylaria curta]|uniref:Uncharacterized protein n=1 Tax=Xylaria curta TaxID=42375 RepID=A0ACC1NHF2_9PEZI|nr:hypothetical protein NUW58_g7475 [Xylaria curta]
MSCSATPFRLPVAVEQLLRHVADRHHGVLGPALDGVGEHAVRGDVVDGRARLASKPHDFPRPDDVGTAHGRPVKGIE